MNNYNNIKDSVKLEALSLDVGESRNCYCPNCNNDPPWPPSLSITRETGGILYNCYRSTCGIKGFISSIGMGIPSRVVSTFKPKPFTYPTRSVTNKLKLLMWNRYQIPPSLIYNNNIKEIINRNGLLIPLYNYKKDKYGNTTKYFDSSYKAIHYLEKQEPRLYFPLSYREGTTIIIVEDVLSTIKLNIFTSSCAILGTNFTPEMVEILKTLGVKKVIMALDEDAVNKSVQGIKKYDLFFDSITTLMLHQDPKDTPLNDLKRRLL